MDTFKRWLEGRAGLGRPLRPGWCPSVCLSVPPTVLCKACFFFFLWGFGDILFACFAAAQLWPLYCLFLSLLLCSIINLLSGEFRIYSSVQTVLSRFIRTFVSPLFGRVDLVSVF